MGASPAAAAAAPRMIVYVAGTAPGSTTVLDQATGRDVNTIAAGGGSGEIALVPQWSRGYIADSGGNTVTVFGTADSSPSGTIAVGAQPHGVAVAPGIRRVFVAEFGADTVSVIDAQRNAVAATVTVGAAPQGVAVAPDERHLYVTTADAVVVVDTATNAVTGRIPVARPYGIAVTPDGSRAYVTGWTSGTVSVIDTAANAVTATVAVGTRPYDVALTPDGRRAYVTNWGTSSVSVLDTAANTVSATVTGIAHPYGVDVTPDGAKAYVTAGDTTGTVTAIDTATGTASTAATLGHGVLGIATGLVEPALPRPLLDISRGDPAGFGGQVRVQGTGYMTLARIASYSFDFGDGTVVTGPDQVLFHTYARGGDYTVTVVATDVLGHTGTASQPIQVTPFVKSMGLMARSNLRYVSAETAGASPAIANRTEIGAWEGFELIDAGRGDVALRAKVNGLLLGVNPADGNRLIASGRAEAGIGTALRFQLVTGADGTLSLLSRLNGKYVTSNAGTAPLAADRAEIGPWEQFWFTYNVDAAALNQSLWLQAQVNQRYVTADAGGAQPLIANRTQIGPWERFDLIDAGDGWVALFSRANGRFVTAENGGNAALIANRTTIGAWEKFKPVRTANGKWALLAGANGKYVTAENGGNSPLIANRTQAGAWEEFAGLA
nr:hypothetical protein GCM10020063_004020 [Dactylosporangium thailandense]